MTSRTTERDRVLTTVLPRQRWLGRGRRREQASAHGIRHRRPRDLAACSRLMRVVFFAEHYPPRWPDSPRAWLDDPDVIDAWVAERQGEILGHVAISRVGQDALSAARWREITGLEPSSLAGVSRFFVRARVRGQGIGGALLDVAAEGARRRGLHPVLETWSPERDGIRFLHDAGWRLLARDPMRSSDSDLQLYRYAAPRQVAVPRR